MNGKKKLLITGGFGNLGSWLTVHFSEKFDVFILSKNLIHKLDTNYKVIQCDITDINSLREKLNITFDYCIHTASYNEFFHENYAEKALYINTLGTRNLIEVLKTTKIKKFIYLSTFHVYGVDSGLVTEETELSPKNDYASTHLFAEYYLKQFYNTDKFPYVIFRLTNGYGSPKHKNNNKWYLVLNDLVQSAYKNNQITLKSNGKSLRDFLWMGDIGSILENSFNLPSDTIFNLSSGRTYSILEIAKMVQKVYVTRYKKDIDIIINTNDISEPLELLVSNEKIKSFINIDFNNKFYDEIESIFDLLEEKNEQ